MIIYAKEPLKYLATINDEALTEQTDPCQEIKYIDIGNVDSNGEISEIAEYRFEDAPSRARRIVRDGDIIISTVRTYLQAIAPIESPPNNLIVSTGFAVVRSKHERLDENYCKYALRAPEFIGEVVSRSVGISYPAINASDLGSIEIYVPPLSEQRQIAEYLDRETQKLDALIAAKKRLLELLAEKRRALITQAVTRGLNADVLMEDSRSILIGEVPRHWQVTYLRRVISQMDYGISESVGVEGKVAVLRMGDIYDGEIHYKNVGFVKEVDPLLMLAPGDLLFNRTNSLDQVGKVGIFREYQEFPVSFASYLVRMRCGKDVLPDFLNYSLNSDPMLKWARSEALPAIGQANLNPNRYSYLPIVIPPIEEQIEILEYLQISTDKIDRLFSATRSTISLLQERRTSLISAAVTGQLQIPD
ncbi:MAG: restriction endonuclease subunit S [Pegethrix bostrychoides GSE-TBD4-15B]|uniref:Restriction endonuclease subunit S n=1 Tax=Pegethrix bostrychoides GSE-TBD4-15B TaxID=2839662 RepID=A0A951U5P5_9CYAN|nr:restriction endonuclease subunit S [Pegethrix bostrychoides GSE-TBD4-15B]